MNEIMKADDGKKHLKKPLKKKGGISTKGVYENIRRNPQIIVLVGGAFILLAITLLLFFKAIGAGASELASSYQIAYADKRDAVYSELYEKYKDTAEKKYHVSNNVSIYIGNLKEEQKLEVLKVSDVEFIIEDREDNEDNIISWLEVPGEGTFIVDLKAGEFIVDNERLHVLARVPYPELTNITIDYGNIQKLLFKDDIWNGSYAGGEELAGKLLNKADVLIKKEFISNQNFYLNAQDAARSAIEMLVKQLNPEVPDLSVDVEFY